MVKILYLVVAIIAIIVLVGASWYVLSKQPQTTKPLPSNTPTPSSSPIVPTTTSPTPTATPSPNSSDNPTSPPYSTSTPTQSPVTTPIPAPSSSPSQTIAATFNFDGGSPTLTAGQPTPFDQTSNGLTAHFSSTADTPSHPAFSTQTINSLSSIAGVINSPNFSGNFLWPSTTNHDSLNIKFSSNITSITLNFKTAELNDPGSGGTGSIIRISAYFNTNAIGSPATNRGVESNDVYPEGTLSLNSPGQPFNQIIIDLPIPTGASGFIIDNITVLTG